MNKQELSIAEIEKNRRYKGLENSSYKDLFDNIMSLENNIELSSRRWIFELLQNCKDVSKDDLNVEIELSKNCLEFRHNGRAFNIDDLSYLIHQISTKEREEKEFDKSIKTTGKFGTGFITTHLLSKKVYY